MTNATLPNATRAPIKIGPLELRTHVLPAPMCGISDRATRTMARQMGCELTYTQMFAAEALCRGDKKTWEMVDIANEETPTAVQLVGSEPERLAEAAKRVADKGAALVDLNMGCPAKKIVGNACGSALMKEPEQVRKIARAMREALPGVPFTVKFRAGWDKNHLAMLEIAEVLEGEGVDAVCLHPRTKEQRFTGLSDWDLITELKSKTKLPVIGNGDIHNGDDATRMMLKTGCDAVMLGRGWMGRPWVLWDAVRKVHPDKAAAMIEPVAMEDPSEVDHDFEPTPMMGEDGGIEGARLDTRDDIGRAVGLTERLRLLREHATLMVQYKGEGRGMIELRKHGVQYVKGLRHATRFKLAFLELRKLADLERLIDAVLDEHR